jgi:ribonucleoside-diphosphate reductase alpha chain
MLESRSNEGKTKEPNMILSDITVFTKYAKYVPSKGRRETWEELVERNESMHINKFPHLKGEIKQAYEFVYDRKILPSMRSLQFGGLPIELANNRIFNCAFLNLDDTAAFSEMMFLLLGGTGVGYSVQKAHVSKLPVVSGTKGTKRFLVEDSIMGWAEAVRVLVDAHTKSKPLPLFDYRDIREKGAALVSTGGKAPGAEPLKQCLTKLQKVLKGAKGRMLSTLEAHDMACFVADAVLTGGIRRAALICLFDRDDKEMLKCKGNKVLKVEPSFPAGWYELTDEESSKKYMKQIPDYYPIVNGFVELPWYEIEPQRGRANNSAVLPRGKVSQEEFMNLMRQVEDSKAGEPGVYWTSNTDWGTNPCCEIGLRSNQMCNLTEISAAGINSQEDLNERAKAAAFIGTLQASYTDFHYLRDIWKETCEEDALIGVGMTGIASGAVLKLDLEEASSIVIEENRRAADLMRINPAKRTTTVKPSGTSSLVLGTSSGIHAWHNEYYIRRMRLGKNEPLYTYLKDALPELVEDDYFTEGQAVASFPQSAPTGSIVRTESPMELLERVRKFNIEWVRGGHVEGDNTHNVSCTISVKDDEWGIVSEWMWENRDNYNGISVLPYAGGTYVQAPFEDITKEQFDAMIKLLNEVDLTQVKEDSDNTDLAGEVACAAGGCAV